MERKSTQSFFCSHKQTSSQVEWVTWTPPHFDINNLWNVLTRVQTAAVAGARRHRGSVRWEPGLHAACTGSLLEGCRTIIWSSHPRVGLPHCVYTAGLLIVWQDWQAPWQSWLKALRSEKWDRYRANTCLLAVSQSPTGRGAGSMAPLRPNVDSFFFSFFFFPDSAALACKEPFTWLFLVLPRLKSYWKEGEVLFSVGEDHVSVQRGGTS